MPIHYDVVIIGGGGSGLAAGVSAAENGASVVLLEKCPFLGGSTGIAVGSFTANRTPWQEKAGIKDDPDQHEEDAGKFGPQEYQAKNNSELRRFFLGLSAESLNWLADMGLNFHGPSPEPPNRVPRMHNVTPNAKAYIAVLQSRLLSLGGRIILNAEAKELIASDGVVSGIKARIDGQESVIMADRGVVLAAGDYANSPELIGRFKGEEFKDIEGINPYSTGGGHVLAEQVGADLVNMEITYGPELRFIAPPKKPFSQLLPAKGLPALILSRLLPLVPKKIMNAMIKRLLVTWQHPEDSLFENGAILINREGRRFCNEKSSPKREISIAAQPDKICYILLDKRLTDLYSAWPNFVSTAPEIAYAYVDDYLRLRPDAARAGGSLEEIARTRDMDYEVLKQTVEDFNNYVSGDSGDPFGRVDDENRLDDDYWVLLGPTKAYFTTTEGGVRINRSMQVLDKDGRLIEGLYAVGSNGLSGMVLWGHGLHIAWAITSGRLAGKALAGNGSGR